MKKEISKNPIYQIIREHKLGSGAYGSVYQCIDKSTENKNLAVKLEPIHLASLKRESKILKILQGGIGVPKEYSFFSSDKFNFLIMDLLGENLKDLFKHQTFNTVTKVNVFIQMLNRIEFLHSKGFIHRDIKPENFVCGLGKNKNTIYLIDYGFTRKYIDSNTKRHIESEINEHLVGTVKYASINSHLGTTLSRRDDLESLAYAIISLWKNELPWDNIMHKNEKDKNDRIEKIKVGISNEDLCDGLHKNIVKFVDYVKKLKFDEKPDYKYLRRLLREISHDNENGLFDWRF